MADHFDDTAKRIEVHKSGGKGRGKKGLEDKVHKLLCNYACLAAFLSSPLLEALAEGLGSSVPGGPASRLRSEFQVSKRLLRRIPDLGTQVFLAVVLLLWPIC